MSPLITTIITILMSLGALLIVWYCFFNFMTRNTDHRIIRRGAGYVIQSKGRIKWLDLRDDIGNSIVFRTKEDAANVLIMARDSANRV